MKHAFYIQIVGGVALGTIAILVLVLDFNTVDLCFDQQKLNWTALPKRTQAVMVAAGCCEAYVVQLWSFFVVLFLFGWPLIKELNLLVLISGYLLPSLFTSVRHLQKVLDVIPS